VAVDHVTRIDAGIDAGVITAAVTPVTCSGGVLSGFAVGAAVGVGVGAAGVVTSDDVAQSELPAELIVLILYWYEVEGVRPESEVDVSSGESDFTAPKSPPTIFRSNTNSVSSDELSAHVRSTCEQLATRMLRSDGLLGAILGLTGRPFVAGFVPQDRQPETIKSVAIRPNSLFIDSSRPS
jgi:hypothetical protein